MSQGEGEGGLGGWDGEGEGGGSPLIELENTNSRFHVFLAIVIAYSSFSKIDQTDLKYFLAHVFFKIAEF